MPSAPLFVTRKFPPMVGGMETFSVGVWRSVERTWPGARLISNGGSQRRLPWWLPVAMARTAYLVARRKVGFVLVGDALAYTVMAPLLRLLRVPHATLVMGLDITWQYRAYRFVAHRALRRAPSVIAISSATAEAARTVAGVAPERIHVVRLGVPVPDEEVDRAVARKELNRWLGLADDQAALLTVGRLVRRKGARWFVENVLPALPPETVLLVAGDGVERAPVEEAAARLGVADRVRLLGRVADAERELLFRGVDAFVQPNVRVPNDMEGFGLVTIEAAVRDALTLASGIEGIRDAVIDGETGVLLPAEQPDAWVERLGTLLADRAEMARLGAAYGRRARELYSEDAMAAGLAAILDRPATGPATAGAAPAASPTVGRRA